MAQESSSSSSQQGGGGGSAAYHRARQAEARELVERYRPSLHIQPLNARTLALHTVLRDRRTDTASFVACADQLLRQLVDAALATLATREVVVETPTHTPFVGCELAREVCAVSIVRAGEAMEAALRGVLPGVRIGKVRGQNHRTATGRARAVNL